MSRQFTLSSRFLVLPTKNQWEDTSADETSGISDLCTTEPSFCLLDFGRGRVTTGSSSELP